MLVLLQTPLVNAQGFLLPRANPDINGAACISILKTYDTYEMKVIRSKFSEPSERNDVLGCGIKTGKIRLWMFPFYITNVINFGLAIAGTLSILFILIGSYQYMIGGLSQDKEKGKKTIMYAVGGLVLAALAWVIINIIIVQITAG